MVTALVASVLSRLLMRKIAPVHAMFGLELPGPTRAWRACVPYGLALPLATALVWSSMRRDPSGGIATFVVGGVPLGIFSIFAAWLPVMAVAKVAG